MKTITSSKNPICQWVKQLQTSKGRKLENAFWVDGEHMVQEAISQNAYPIKAIFVAEEKKEKYANLLNTVQVEKYLLPLSLLESLSQVKTSQGISAVCEKNNISTLQNLGQKIVLLENVQDPGNVGTILRTMDAAGFTGALLTEGCSDPFSPKSLRASMGSIFRIPFIRISESTESIAELHKKGFTTIATCLEGTPYYSRKTLNSPLCVLMGNEGLGLKKETINACVKRYRLPMLGGAESLNVAIATAIILYDLQFRN